MAGKNLLTEEDIAKGFYPLRPIQRWLINTHFNKAKSTMMNIAALVKVHPDLDIEKIINSMNKIIDTHDIFRCRLVFHPETCELCQRFDGEVQHIIVKEMSDEEFETAKKSLTVPYMLIDKPLYRLCIFKTPSANYYYMDYYHAITDGTSASLLFAHEVDLYYHGKNLKREPSKYADYVEEEFKIPDENLREGAEYWRAITKNFDAKKHLPPADLKDDGKWRQNIIDCEFKNISAEYFATQNHKENIFFMAASMFAIAKSTDAKSAMLSWIHNGRMTAHELRLMGLMLEQYPIAWNFENDMTVGDFLNKLEEKVSEGIKYRKSLGKVYLDGSQNNCATFIFQKNIYAEHFIVDGKASEYVELFPNEWAAAENSLDIEVNSTEAGIYVVELDYNASKYSEQAMKNLAKSMDEIILQLQDEKILISEILED